MIAPLRLGTRSEAIHNLPLLRSWEEGLDYLHANPFYERTASYSNCVHVRSVSLKVQSAECNAIPREQYCGGWHAWRGPVQLDSQTDPTSKCPLEHTHLK